MDKKACMKIAATTARCDIERLKDILENYLLDYDANQLTFDLDYSALESVMGLTDEERSTWQFYTVKFLEWLNDIDNAKVPFTIFAKGNSKLPFYSFSNLPIVNCPGAGECAKWCYSLKAWRYPAAFFRQVQNTLLVKLQHSALKAAWDKLPTDVDIRLYVDGDFDSMATLEYWFNRMNDRKDLRVYGYSKSWILFLNHEKSGGEFPTNYTLNLSSGSKYKQDIRDEMEKLPIVRGNFTAFDIPADIRAKYESMMVREVAKKNGVKRTFVCPGQCGKCMLVKGKNVHACGSKDLMKGVNVVIATH